MKLASTVPALESGGRIEPTRFVLACSGAAVAYRVAIFIGSNHGAVFICAYHVAKFVCANHVAVRISTDYVSVFIGTENVAVLVSLGCTVWALEVCHYQGNKQQKDQKRVRLK